MQAGTIKLATSSKSRFHDGFDYHYNHVECFFRIKRPTSVAEIAHYETLKFEDQKMLEEAIDTNGKSVIMAGSQEPTTSKSSSKREKRESPSISLNYDDFLIDYAKSNRSTCVKCEKKIEKALPRIGKLDYNAEKSFNNAPIPRWRHVECFAKSIEQVEFYGDVTKVKGFDELSKEDKKLIKGLIKPTIPDPALNGKKMKKEEVPNEENKLLKEQSDRFFKLREKVSTMKRKDIEVMLSHMSQKSDYKDTATLIDMATDVLMFGPLKECPQCKESRHIRLKASRYICTGTGSDGQTCTYETGEPKRGPPDIPEEIQDSYDFFDKYKFKPGKRLFSSKLLKAVQEKEEENNNTAVEDGPLQGITIGVTSWQALNTDKVRVQKKVASLGGNIVTSLDRSLFIILSSEDELKKDSPKIEVAKALEVPFATEEFLFKIEKIDDVVAQLSKCLINNWEGDLQERFTKMRSPSKNDSSSSQ